MIEHFSFTFFNCFAFATQLFSTPVTSSHLRNLAPLFTEHRLSQGTDFAQVFQSDRSWVMVLKCSCLFVHMWT